jgi:hypothetical protein
MALFSRGFFMAIAILVTSLFFGCDDDTGTNSVPVKEPDVCVEAETHIYDLDCVMVLEGQRHLKLEEAIDECKYTRQTAEFDGCMEEFNSYVNCLKKATSCDNPCEAEQTDLGWCLLF